MWHHAASTCLGFVIMSVLYNRIDCVYTSIYYLPAYICWFVHEMLTSSLTFMMDKGPFWVKNIFMHNLHYSLHFARIPPGMHILRIFISFPWVNSLYFLIFGSQCFFEFRRIPEIL